MNLSPKQFVDILVEREIQTGSGISDPFLKPVVEEINSREDIQYIPVYAPTTALGITTGIRLTKKRSALFIPNSDLWSIGNSLITTNLMYGAPILIVVSWRGEPRIETQYEHVINGKMMFDLLDGLNIYWAFPSSTKTINYAIDLMEEQGNCSAIVVRGDEFD
jgi:phosphonopyruvate decarboxylase